MYERFEQSRISSKTETAEMAEFKETLLEFIEQTAERSGAINHYYHFTGGFAEEFTHRQAEFYSEQFNEDIQRINTCLAMIDGIPVAFIDPRDGEHMIGRVVACTGLSVETLQYDMAFTNDKYINPIPVPLTGPELRAYAQSSST